MLYSSSIARHGEEHNAGDGGKVGARACRCEETAPAANEAISNLEVGNRFVGGCSRLLALTNEGCDQPRSCADASALSRRTAISSFGTAPITRPTSLPPAKTIIVGTPRIL